jgi:alkylation response protein AidB-like acyl-CoA dehydrogenase
VTASAQELDDLRATIRKFLDTRIPEQRLRELLETSDAFDADLWSEMTTSLGLHSLAVPEKFGGDEVGWAELSVVFEELGRALAPVPYLANVVAAQALLQAGDDAASQRYLPHLADGSMRATVAVAERDGSWDAATISTRATQDADGAWRLDGTKSWVPNAAGADVVFVFGRTTAGPTLFAVDPEAAGVERASMRVLDGTRPLWTLRLTSAPARLIGREGAAGAVLSRILDLAGLALACEQVGAAQRCLEISVEYAQVRVQFGRPIGTFQAVKHLCAEMLAQVEMARAATQDAARLTDENSIDAPAAAVAAHITCSTAAMFTAKETIQVLGGIGFTWDHPAHLYFRRAAASQMFLGGPARSHERLLDRLGI